MIEKFELSGKSFTAEIEEFIPKGINYYGKYTIKVKNEDNKIIAALSPSESFVNGKSYPHKYLRVNEEYRSLGLAKWLFEQSKKLNDVLQEECVPKQDLESFYKKMNYEVVEKIKDDFSGEIFTILRFKNLT